MVDYKLYRLARFRPFREVDNQKDFEFVLVLAAISSKYESSILIQTRLHVTACVEQIVCEAQMDQNFCLKARPFHQEASVHIIRIKHHGLQRS